jgi:hypothetical protein
MEINEVETLILRYRDLVTRKGDTIKEHKKICDETGSVWFEDFYENLFYMKPNEYISPGRRFLLGKAVPVEIVCLNSSYLTQHKDLFQGAWFPGKAADG